MPKKYSTTTTLVIVESPAKCKKIEEYLGPGYKCIATYGHLREIVSLNNIDITNNFTPTYTIIDNAIKRKQIEKIRKEIKNASNVILSSDLDREGEMIAFSIIELFKLPLNTPRITFNEITETAIQYAIKNPKTIDMDLVQAQKARQILDLLVGFKVSPMLWKCISAPKGKEFALSAGRCQTPALRLVYDNEVDIKQHGEIKVYNTTGYFTKSNIAFELTRQYKSEDEIREFLTGSVDFSHIYKCSQPIKNVKKPPEPFTTSRIQQAASNELHYSPKETMRICQQLYESGYITYMRTDSQTYSDDFLNYVKAYITSTYTDGDKYVGDMLKTAEIRPEEIRPHEAIRPTDISLNELLETIDSKQRRLYKLIWNNTLESCMKPATYLNVTASISSFQNNTFTYTSELIDFPGWKIVANKYSTENKEFQYLQTIKQNSCVPYKKMCSRVTIKGLKLRYTEARLVQLLEEKGIGRPSTFSSLIDKIQERGYVKKENITGTEIECKDFELENKQITEVNTKREFGNEKGKLVIQPLGIIVMEFLEKRFDELFNYNYTCIMENALDKISKGELLWVELCESCNKQIDMLIDDLKDETKIEIKLDDNNTYMIGKYGPVIKCVEEIDGKEEIKFKPIRKDVDINSFKKGDCKVEDMIDTSKNVKSQYILGQYNGKDVILRKGKFGLYVSCGDISKTLKELGNRPIDNITFDEVKKYLEEGSNFSREINSSISIRKGPKGDYLFYKNSKMKKPQFLDIKAFTNDTKEDYKICDITILRSWISEKYNII
jgi:DNA topoisomerase-1